MVQNYAKLCRGSGIMLHYAKSIHYAKIGCSIRRTAQVGNDNDNDHKRRGQRLQTTTDHQAQRRPRARARRNPQVVSQRSEY